VRSPFGFQNRRDGAVPDSIFILDAREDVSKSPMTLLSEQRCFNHVAREAVARCPQCTRCYCRECITEHEDRVVCAACLKRLVKPGARSKRRLDRLAQLAQSIAGLIIAWLFFYMLGRGLLLIPTTFHEGTVWDSSEQVGP